MRRSIAIHIGAEDTALAALRYDQQGARESAAFEYDAGWLAAPDRFSIEPGLPLVGGPQFHRKTGDGSVFHSAIADTEPDGWGRRVIQRDHAKRRQNARRAGDAVETGPLNAMDYLLAVDDVSRVGALRLKDEEGRYQRTVEEGRRTTPPLIELGQLLAATRQSRRTPRRVRTSPICAVAAHPLAAFVPSVPLSMTMAISRLVSFQALATSGRSLRARCSP